MEKINSFINEINNMISTNKSHTISSTIIEDLHKLNTYQNLISGSYDFSNQCLLQDPMFSYNSYKEYYNSITTTHKKRRMKTKNLICPKCSPNSIQMNLIIDTSNEINTYICPICNYSINKQILSQTNNKIDSHIKRCLENYTGEMKLSKQLINLMPYLSTWFKDLKYFHIMHNEYILERNKTWSTKEKDLLSIQSNSFSADFIPNINLFKYIVNYFHKFLILTHPSSTLYNYEIAKYWKDKLQFDIDYNLIVIPKGFIYYQYYYTILIHIFQCPKLEITADEKKEIINIYCEFNKYNKTLKNNSNSNLYYVILKHIFLLPKFNGKFNYIIPALSTAKVETESNILKEWYLFSLKYLK